VASENTTTKSKSYTRREATQLVMGVATLGLALGKTPVAAAEGESAQIKKVVTFSKAENSIYIKLNATEKAMFLKLDAGERSTFTKHQDWSETEKSTFLKVQSKD
jgi:hypothetical protein